VSVIDGLMVVAALAAGLWWALSRRRRPAALEALSLGALLLALVTLAVDGIHWQLVPWQILALAATAAAALRRWRPGHSRRWRRVIGRGVLVVGLAVAGVALLTAFVPTLPQPAGPHKVGSEIFRWTDSQRAETLTANPSDHRQVIAQAWYPSDASNGATVPYFEAQGHLPGSVGGMPSFMFASFSSVRTHAMFGTPMSSARKTWPVLLFSPGLSNPRELYTALCADLASRGYVVIALSVPYESAVSVLARGQIVGQTTHPDVMGPPPHPDVGHSIGGATAVQVMAADPRFKVGVDLDGKLFGAERNARLNRPFLWIQSGTKPDAEYAKGRDRFLAGLRDGGALLTVNGSIHTSFTDGPSYLTALGRSLIGGATVGSISVQDMTAMTGDTIAAFAGPALGVKNGNSLDQVIARHPAIRSERRIAPKPW
jgi:dienelactone hydrolase